VSKVDVITMNA